jgi:hypothetical protein
MKFYDNLEPTPIDESVGTFELERNYCFEWNEFDKYHWQKLSEIYEKLPGKVRYADVPWWFGYTEESSTFLWASVEPSGLQVYGVLIMEDWLAWDSQFRSASIDLPMQKFQQDL